MDFFFLMSNFQHARGLKRADVSYICLWLLGTPADDKYFTFKDTFYMTATDGAMLDL